MKTITKASMLLALLFLVGFNAVTKAQCPVSFTSQPYANAYVGFSVTTTPSVGTTNYYWNFGPAGTYSGTGVAGMGVGWTFPANGTYTVTLTIVTVPTCTSSFSQVITVSTSTNNNFCFLQAGFSNWLPGGPGQMNFTNNSSGTVSGTTYTWNYGDNTTSNGVNGSHTYAANGNYLVKLFANNNVTPACVDSQAVWVNINTICNLSPSFIFTPGNNGLMNFQSTSTGTISGTVYSWSFGDGGNGSGATTAHTYTNGNYNAVLTVINNSVSCTSTVGQVVVVTNNTCSLNGSYT